MKVMDLYSLKKKIFPVMLQDVELDVQLENEPNYDLVVGLLNGVVKNGREYSRGELEFVLRYKKFLEMEGTISMCNQNDINLVETLIRKLNKDGIKGCLIECGVYKGGMSMWMRAVDKFTSGDEVCRGDVRKLYMFDTFSYFPAPSPNAPKKEELIHNITKMLYTSYHTTNQIRDNFHKFGLSGDGLHFVEGEFKDTIPKFDIGDEIAFLRLDNDYYESVMLVLENYYSKIVKGGYIVIDDYLNDVVGCKEAVNDFRLFHCIETEICYSDDGPVYWRIDR